MSSQAIGVYKFKEIRTHVLYEAELAGLSLFLGNGDELDVTFALTSGRANYILFQWLACHFTGLSSNGEGGNADLCDSVGRTFEVKSYKDPALHSAAKHDLFHTAASSTFGPNNHGPAIAKLLKADNYPEAFRLCEAAGYAHNDFYVYTNTSQFQLSVPFRFFILPTSDVVARLSLSDPRLVSRRHLLAALSHSEQLG